MVIKYILRRQINNYLSNCSIFSNLIFLNWLNYYRNLYKLKRNIVFPRQYSSWTIWVFHGGFFFVGLLTLIKYVKLQRELKVKNEKIDLYLKSIKSGYEVKLPILIQRSTLNRLEIIGRLHSALIDKSSRLSIKFLTEPSFYEEIERVRYSNSEKKLMIWCTNEEIEQFQINEKT